MALAPEVSAFGDGAHDAGATGLTISGGGFGASGTAWIYANSDRTGNSDQLTVGTWNDIELSGVEISGSPNNSDGTRYLFVQREDLAWSNAFSFTLGAPVAAAAGIGGGTARVRFGRSKWLLGGRGLLVGR